jgi:hypothetical protein
MTVRISGEPGDPSPIEAKNAKVVHRPSLFVQASAKGFNSCRVIELPLQVRGCRACKSFEIRLIHIRDSSISSAAAD